MMKDKTRIDTSELCAGGEIPDGGRWINNSSFGVLNSRELVFLIAKDGMGI